MSPDFRCPLSKSRNQVTLPPFLTITPLPSKVRYKLVTSAPAKSCDNNRVAKITILRLVCLQFAASLVAERNCESRFELLTRYLTPYESGIMFGSSICFVGMLLGVAGMFVDDEPAENKPADEAGQMELTTEQVVVFKDGYCLVVKDGVAKTDANGLAHTYEVPDAAVLGSFWAVPQAGKIKSMVAGWDENKATDVKRVNCTDVHSIVKANVGRECSFELGDDQFEGTILKLLSNEVDEPTADTATQAAMHASSAFIAVKATASHFVLRSKVGDVMVAINQVKNLTIDEMVSTTEQSTVKVTKRKKLTLNFGKPNQDVKIKLMYFRPDVRWIPTYRIELTDEPFKNKSGNAPRNTARISMQGEILNEAEDLVDVPFHLVVGVPNFRFRETPSPMILEAQLQNSLASVAPNFMSNAGSNSFSNALYTQRAGEFRSQQAGGGSDRAVINMPDELSGKASQDLFVYKLDNMTLKKGERASVPILTTAVGYRDVYTWDIAVKHSESYEASGADLASPLVLSENKVWRQIELVNDTDIPWTTGAAMFVDGLQPLAQELLTYTSPGGICRVPVTVAIDLRGKVDDREVSRDLKAIKYRGYSYAKVVGKMNAELANNKLVKVPVEVNIRFGGKVTKASDEGKMSLSGFNEEDWEGRGDAINNRSEVHWKAEIEPGECFKPELDYEFWLRR